MTIAYLALGSNLGDRLVTLRTAVRALAGHSDLRSNPACDVASLYETDSVGGPPAQPHYLNSAMRVQTLLSPVDLLAATLAIETSLGRVRRERWEPRIIDIDLLFYGDAVIDSPALTLPHPRLHERRFVLEPLSELAADLIHPLTGVSIGALAQLFRRECGTDMVMRIQGPEWVLESAAW